jgi:hypothetical protein
MKNLNKLKISLILLFLLLILIISSSSISKALEPPYRASVTIELDWADEYPKTPIAPRDEIAIFELKITMNIVTGATFGAGLLEGYSTGIPEVSGGSSALIDLIIDDYPSWCSVTLDQTLLMTNISEKEEAFCKLYIHVDEDAPAYEEGIIKFRVNISDLGLIKGDSKTFNLSFKPSYYPIIKTNLPEITKRIDPTSNAVFPIKIQNYGNAETKVLFDILEIPEGWTATVTDSIIVAKEKGSKETAYLTVYPSRNFGYHYNEALISVKITPAFAENLNITGESIYANFIIQNRGFSPIGIEIYSIFFVIIAIVIYAIILFIKKRKN